MLGSGVYVTGSVGLSVGSRYGLQLDGTHLRVLGPVHLDPATVALKRDLVGMNAASEDGRLVINQVHGDRAIFVLVFMALNGESSETAAAKIVQAASAAETTAR
jgi:hypothetical protein